MVRKVDMAKVCHLEKASLLVDMVLEEVVEAAQVDMEEEGLLVVMEDLQVVAVKEVQEVMVKEDLQVAVAAAVMAVVQIVKVEEVH